MRSLRCAEIPTAVRRRGVRIAWPARKGARRARVRGPPRTVLSGRVIFAPLGYLSRPTRHARRISWSGPVLCSYVICCASSHSAQKFTCDTHCYSHNDGFPQGGDPAARARTCRSRAVVLVDVSAGPGSLLKATRQTTLEYLRGSSCLRAAVITSLGHLQPRAPPSASSHGAALSSTSRSSRLRCSACSQHSLNGCPRLRLCHHTRRHTRLIQ